MIWSNGFFVAMMKMISLALVAQWNLLIQYLCKSFPFVICCKICVYHLMLFPMFCNMTPIYNTIGIWCVWKYKGFTVYFCNYVILLFYNLQGVHGGDRSYIVVLNYVIVLQGVNEGDRICFCCIIMRFLCITGGTWGELIVFIV